jgi:hypothetical protein
MNQTTDKGFLGALFDFSFSHYVTPTIIRIIFGIVIVVSAILALLVAIAAFDVNIVLGFLVLIIFGPLIFLVYVILYRVFLEVVMAVFKIAENTTKLVEGEGRSNAQGWTGPMARPASSAMPPPASAGPPSAGAGPPPPMPNPGSAPPPWPTPPRAD